MTLTAKKITKDFYDISKVDALMKEAFPAYEREKTADLLARSETGEYDFWALYDEGSSTNENIPHNEGAANSESVFIGLMFVAHYKQLAYLWFFAIEKKLRSHGYGANALKLLYTLYPDKVFALDTEVPDKSRDNYEQRVSRRKFYEKNGWKASGYIGPWRGDNYEIYTLNDSDDSVLKLCKEFENVVDW